MQHTLGELTDLLSALNPSKLQDQVRCAVLLRCVCSGWTPVECFSVARLEEMGESFTRLPPDLRCVRVFLRHDGIAACLSRHVGRESLAKARVVW